MKYRKESFKLSAIALAVTSLIVATSARADDQEVADLTMPKNTVEIGGLYNAANSSRFGEYNGLNKRGELVFGNLNLRGGDAYGKNESGATSRWSLTGTDLGTTSQSWGASFSDQGQWNMAIGYDALKHNSTDSYQTPYVGGNGDNNFTLPPGFGLVTTTGAGAPGTNNLSPAQRAALHTMDISTTRVNRSLNAGLILNTQWSINVDYNHLDQTGAKLMGFGSAGVGGANGEVVSILPMPTMYKTDTVNMALNWVGDKGHVTTSYFGSFFRDGYDRVNFTTFSGANNTNSMTTAPNNTFHQLNLGGGYVFTPTTKLTSNFSYGRNSQDSTFVAPETGLTVTPFAASSLHGLVLNKHADMKLTNQTSKKLVLSAGFRYDLRDNKTPSNIYNFNAISGGNTANYPNTPLSNSKKQIELAGDYRIKQDHNVRLDYVREDIARWCNQYAVNAGYPAGTNCVVAKSSTEDKVGLTYRFKPIKDVALKLGYSYSDRRAELDPNAIAAMIGTNGGLAGQNAGDFRGFVPFFEASRLQNAFKVNTNWQATEKFSVGASAKYTRDGYLSTFGVQNGHSWSMNLDSTYAYSENGSVYSYLTGQHRDRAMTNVQRATASAPSVTAIGVPANGTWTNNLVDNDFTVGIGAKQSKLLRGKFDLAGDLTYTLGKTDYGTQLNYSTTTTGGFTCSNPAILSCGDLPTIKSETTQFKLTGTYTVEKGTRLVGRYIFQRMNAADYFYNGYQYGSSPSGLMPTNQQVGAYNNNVIALSFIHDF